MSGFGKNTIIRIGEHLPSLVTSGNTTEMEMLINMNGELKSIRDQIDHLTNVVEKKRTRRPSAIIYNQHEQLSILSKFLSENVKSKHKSSIKLTHLTLYLQNFVETCDDVQKIFISRGEIPAMMRVLGYTPKKSNSDYVYDGLEFNVRRYTPSGPKEGDIYDIHGKLVQSATTTTGSSTGRHTNHGTFVNTQGALLDSRGIAVSCTLTPIVEVDDSSTGEGSDTEFSGGAICLPIHINMDDKS